MLELVVGSQEVSGDACSVRTVMQRTNMSSASRTEEEAPGIDQEIKKSQEGGASYGEASLCEDTLA